MQCTNRPKGESGALCKNVNHCLSVVCERPNAQGVGVCKAPTRPNKIASVLQKGSNLPLPLANQPRLGNALILFGGPVQGLKKCESGFSLDNMQVLYPCKFNGEQRPNSPNHIGREVMVEVAGTNQNGKEITVDLKRYQDRSFVGTESAKVNFYYHDGRNWKFGEFCFMGNEGTTCRKSFAQPVQVNKVLVAVSASKDDKPTIVPYVADIRLRTN